MIITTLNKIKLNISNEALFCYCILYICNDFYLTEREINEILFIANLIFKKQKRRFLFNDKFLIKDYKIRTYLSPYFIHYLLKKGYLIISKTSKDENSYIMNNNLIEIDDKIMNKFVSKSTIKLLKTIKKYILENLITIRYDKIKLNKNSEIKYNKEDKIYDIKSKVNNNSLYEI